MISDIQSQEFKGGSTYENQYSIIYHITRMKEKNMIFPIDSENVFDKIQHLLLIFFLKSTQQIRNRNEHPQPVKQHL